MASPSKSIERFGNMSNPQRQKGNRLENKIVQMAQEAGIKAVRAWGSNGKSLGLTDDVDVLMGPYKIQAKARKAIADFIKPPPGADITVVQEIRKGHTEEPLAVLPLKLLLEILKSKGAKHGNENSL
jgi:hypothetical protein